jgi:sulfur-carrier protein
MIQVALPFHLCTLARVEKGVMLEDIDLLTLGELLNAVEEKYPVLKGTIRDQSTLARRPFVRFFAGSEDLSLAPAETKLSENVRTGKEVFRIVGAIAGG